MISWKWVTVTTVVGLAVCFASHCPDAKEGEHDATQLSKFGRDLGTFAGATGTAVVKFAEVAEKFASLAGFLGPIGGIVSGVADLFFPKSDCPPLDPRIGEIKTMLEHLTKAVEELTSLVTVKFAELSSKIDAAVTEIEAHQVALYWTEHVATPLKKLRTGALQVIGTNFSVAAQTLMAVDCKNPAFGPEGIATHIWGLLGAGCNGNKEKLLQGPFCDPNEPGYVQQCREIQTTCLAETYIKNAEYRHDTSDYIYNLVVNTMIELTTYQALCVNFTYKEDAIIIASNERFRNITMEVMNGLPKIVEREIERYWPEAAQKYAQSFMDGPSAKDNAEKAFNAFNERYSWYHHQMFLVRRKDSRKQLQIDLNGLFPPQWKTAAIAITATEQQKDVSDKLLVVRYRVASDSDKKNVREQYSKYKEWLKTKIQNDPACHDAGADSDTVQGCLVVAANTGNFENLKKALDQYAGKEIDWSRNHGYAHIGTSGGDFDINNFGDCKDGVCYFVVKGVNGVIHFM